MLNIIEFEFDFEFDFGFDCNFDCHFNAGMSLPCVLMGRFLDSKFALNVAGLVNAALSP